MLFGEEIIEPQVLVDDLAARIRKDCEWGDPNPKWTSAVKVALRQMGNSRGLKFEGFLRGEQHCHEWLFDVVWWKENFGSLLVVESEWGSVDDVLEDFEKLLAVKSPTKLMVCCANPKSEREALIRRISHQMLTNFEQHVMGEVYVVLDFHPPYEAFSYTVPNNGKLTSRPEFTKIPLCHAANAGS